jgi:hypothetical protein
MPGIFREVDIQWKGQKVTFVPTMQLLRRIEREVSIMGLLGRVSRGDFSAAEVAFVICEFLRAGGVKSVTDEDVYSEIIDDMASEGSKGQGVLALIAAISEAITPIEPAAKNASAGPAAQTKPATTKTRPKRG